MRATIYVQYFTSGERGVRKKQNCIYDFFDFAEPVERTQPFEGLIGLGFMHRSFDDACRNGVYADAVLGMLNCQGARHRIQSALDHDLNCCSCARVSMANKRC